MADLKANVADIMERIPTVARLYCTGIPPRRYRRASVMNGPGEPLVHRSHVERELTRLLASHCGVPPSQGRSNRLQGDDIVFPQAWSIAGVDYPPGQRPAVVAGVITIDGVEYTVKWTGYLRGLNRTRREAIVCNSAGVDYE